MITLYLIRHGETDANKHGILQGQQNTLLNSNGLSQAKTLAGACQHLTINTIHSSDLARASSTAAQIAQPHQLTPKLTPLLREIGFGSLEGQHLKLMPAEKQYHLQRLYTQQINLPYADAEPLAKLESRLSQFIKHLSAESSGNHAIIGHGYSLNYLLHHLLNWPKQNMQLLELANCSVTEVIFNRQQWQLVRLNQQVNSLSSILK
ncbi:histidine phosphatase family protein [Motilimonas sp. 1_MG-2023]|uniref:histidine phosphatase family protein n=1 Tax=Motilimonas sp. 1_MG-2023 TaxID=3062672 RepID=UPI0026E1DB60|nr:histidine phosphatase family protein [Motilimonas sp. 1_MG-2023]MDO6525316.1 histidine phosphatase family protein [Motilimonas sp. 1_MG-2023]